MTSNGCTIAAAVVAGVSCSLVLSAASRGAAETGRITASRVAALESRSGWARAASASASVTKDGCTLTLSAPEDHPTGLVHLVVAQSAVTCSRRHRHAHWQVSLQEFVPTVWLVGSEVSGTLTIPRRDRRYLAARYGCIAGEGNRKFRSKATLTFTDQGRRVRLVTPFTRSTVSCG